MASHGANADAFTHLSSDVRSALSDRGFSTPTEPQQRAIPPLSDGNHALVFAPTGTGKTESAMLPVFSQLTECESAFGIGALLVTPLRSLNRDMLDRLEWWGDQLELDVDVRHGDTTQYQRQKQADDPPDVLITTPETIQAMLTGSKLRTALEDLEHVVVDEIHELAGAKRGAQLTVGLERLEELAGPFQRIGLSATIGDPEEIANFLTGDRPCTVVEATDVGRVDITVYEPEVTSQDESLAQDLLTDADVASHLRAIDSIVRENESTLIFVNTRQTAEGLGSRLKEMGTNIGIHHGSLSKETRIAVENEFKDGDLDALLCTSSMELGIDVGRIDHVVQYQSPRQVRRLLQRIGRAGHRRDEVSRGTVITSNSDDTLEAMTIARRAAYGEVESAEIHHGSLDTVANQVVGLVMGYGEIPAMRAYSIIVRAYPFRDLTEDQFKDIVEEVADSSIIYLDRDADLLKKTGGSWQYFYSNLSMIPDEATYTVKDIASGRPIGTLDERFVVNFAEPGELFVQRGEMWRINDIEEEEEEVRVTPVEDPTGEVPSWTGSEIPVPFDVAQEVGDTRDVVARQARAGPDLAAELTETYPVDDRTLQRALAEIEDQDEELMPTDSRVVVEYYGRTVVINGCFGHKTNETIGRLLAALIGQRSGSSVGLDVDPYRIELEVPQRITGGTVVDILLETEPQHVEGILELSLRNTDSLRFTLAQVATKFGILKEWRGTGGREFGRGRLIDALDESPAYDEAVREVLHDELAVERAAAVLEDIQTGDRELVTVGDRTPVGMGGRSAGSELISPDKADASVIQTVRDRIQSDDVLLFCVHCEEWTRRTTVKRAPEQPTCPLCDSTRIAALSPWAEEVVDAVRADEKDDEQDVQTAKAHRRASLVQSHGKKAIIALSARGVGPENAARIINRARENEDDFYRDILERERQYARTKAFWD